VLNVIITEHYLQSIAALVAALSLFPELLRPLVEYVSPFIFPSSVLNNSYRTHLSSGTTASVLSSYTILAILNPDADSHLHDESPNLFQNLGLLRSVAQKVQESAANEKPSIARPAREARDLLKELDDESLQGFF